MVTVELKELSMAWKQRIDDFMLCQRDLALQLARQLRVSGRVIGLDAAAAPLEQARRRQLREPWLHVEWLQGDALDTGLDGRRAIGGLEPVLVQVGLQGVVVQGQEGLG